MTVTTASPLRQLADELRQIDRLNPGEQVARLRELSKTIRTTITNYVDATVHDMTAGATYREVGELVGLSPESVDQAVQRHRRRQRAGGQG